MTLDGEKVSTTYSSKGISTLSLCDKECVTCNAHDSEWECKCWGNSVLHRSIECVDYCPSGQTPGPSGLCLPSKRANWVELMIPQQRMPPHDFTFRFEAPRLAEILLTTDNFIIGSSYVEIYGKRHDFDDAHCLDDVCVYTISADAERLLFWVDFELIGNVPITRALDINQGDKIPGEHVLNTYYKLGIYGPERENPGRNL